MFEKIEAICGKKDADDLRDLHSKVHGSKKVDQPKAASPKKVKKGN
jgi:hypothetical protein